MIFLPRRLAKITGTSVDVAKTQQTVALPLDARAVDFQEVKNMQRFTDCFTIQDTIDRQLSGSCGALRIRLRC
jgi:hypothetical protein